MKKAVSHGKLLVGSTLVTSAEAPSGNGRTKPPLSQAEFARQFREWIEKGAAAPEQ